MAIEISYFEPHYKSGYGASGLQEKVHVYFSDLKGLGFATALCEVCSDSVQGLQWCRVRFATVPCKVCSGSGF